MILNFSNFIKESIDTLLLHNKEEIEDLFLSFKDDGYTLSIEPCYYDAKGNKKSITFHGGIGQLSENSKVGWNISMTKKFKIKKKLYTGNNDITTNNLEVIIDEINDINQITKKLNLFGYNVDKQFGFTTSTISFNIRLLQKEKLEISQVKTEILVDYLANKYYNSIIGKSWKETPNGKRFMTDSFAINGDEIKVTISSDFFNKNINYMPSDSMSITFRNIANEVKRTLAYSRFKEYGVFDITTPEEIFAVTKKREDYSFTIRKKSSPQP